MNTNNGDKMDICTKELINGLNMGLISIDHLVDKIQDEKMRDIVLHLRKEFGDLKDKVFQESSQEDEVRKSFMLESMIELKTLISDDSHIAKMLIEGCNQSVMTMTHLFNQEKHSRMQFQKYMNDFEDISKRYIEELKAFL